jgi:hypothetical protein
MFAKGLELRKRVVDPDYVIDATSEEGGRFMIGPFIIMPPGGASEPPLEPPEEPAEEPPEEPAEVKEAADDDSGGTRLGTVAGVLVFLSGAFTTLLTLVTNFGADESGLAAARRNHSTALAIAAALAALGMLCAVAFAAARVIGTPRWLRAVLILVGAALVLAGGVLGIKSTIDRDPGDVAIAIERISKNAASVTITGEGFPSNKRFEAIVTGYHTSPVTDEATGVPSSKPVLQLARGRFSPVQSGEVNWTVPFKVSTTGRRTPRITYLLVVVHDALDAVTNCNLGSQLDNPPTCVWVRLQPPPVASKKRAR